MSDDQTAPAWTPGKRKRKAAPPLLLNHSPDAALPPAIADAARAAVSKAIASGAAVAVKVSGTTVLVDPDCTGQLVRLGAVDLAGLRDSPLQPRTQMDPAQLATLTADVRANGLLQPLVFRRVQLDDGTIVRELIFGHRRKRAAIAAGVSAPAIEQPMSDAEVLIAQMAENREREELSPLDEARGYAQLRQLEGINAPEVAKRMGVSARTVFQRLQLLDLVPTALGALEQGEIGAEVASYVARVDKRHQAAALALALATDWRGERKSTREIRAELVDKFTLELKGAPWALDDAELVPSAGACTACPKRCGAQPELFGDVIEAGQLSDEERDVRGMGDEPAGPDVCPDPDCFADKKDAHQRRLADELAAKTGATVIAGKEAARALKVSAYSSHAALKGKEYVQLADARAALKALPKDARPAPVILLADNGAKLEVLRAKDLAAAGVKVPKRASPQQQYEQRRAKQEAEDAKRTQRVKVEYAARRAIWQRVVDTVPTRERGTEELRAITAALLDGLRHCHGDAEALVVKALGVKGTAELRKNLEGMGPQHLARAAVLMAAARQVPAVGYMTDFSCPLLESIATANGIDARLVRKEVEAKHAPTPIKQAAPPASSAKGKHKALEKIKAELSARKAAKGKKGKTVAPAARVKK